MAHTVLGAAPQRSIFSPEKRAPSASLRFINLTNNQILAAYFNRHSCQTVKSFNILIFGTEQVNKLFRRHCMNSNLSREMYADHKGRLPTTCRRTITKIFIILFDHTLSSILKKKVLIDFVTKMTKGKFQN